VISTDSNVTIRSVFIKGLVFKLLVKILEAYKPGVLRISINKERLLGSPADAIFEPLKKRVLFADRNKGAYAGPLVVYKLGRKIVETTIDEKKESLFTKRLLIKDETFDPNIVILPVEIPLPVTKVDKEQIVREVF
jgi:hypothetical protein